MARLMVVVVLLLLLLPLMSLSGSAPATLVSDAEPCG